MVVEIVMFCTEHGGTIDFEQCLLYRVIFLHAPVIHRFHLDPGVVEWRTGFIEIRLSSLGAKASTNFANLGSINAAILGQAAAGNRR